MYLDIIVLSGIGVVGLMVAFLVGFFYILRKEGHRNDPEC
ncbi:cytochrome c oxidase subunit CcoM [Reinekea marina]|uniref:Cytochrome c oxidase subunit CcoM n=1 Tax=Reinekea marina TaxID=1310421 RepID=A0ABV7WST4_9GAMM|nr:cytochrome c oxidase subunit CcoM [Reinekea marina]MDN3650295.1 cytochrome c oxidase subunit CcoM [Reinekea marina]MDN3651093.1 cytochrome c oxidase subunit CcoM [Reinekea marina]